MTNNKDKKIDIIIEILIWLASIIVIVPIVIVLFGSLKSPAEAARATIELPKQLHFENFIYVFKEGGMGRAFLNSLLITVTTVFTTIMVAAPCGYVISRRGTRASNRLYKYIFIGMVAPYQIVTTFLLFKTLHISGYLSVIALLIAVNIPFCTILFEGFTKSIPCDIDEAAAIDGCGSLQLFLRIIFPLLKPVTMTCTVTTAIAVWNEFMVPLYLLSSSKQWPLTMTVYNFFGLHSSQWNYVFANLVITALPIIILYLFLQKHIVAGLTSGAVKG